MSKPLALVSDFDGTISSDDFFWMIAERYLDSAALEPWNLYLRGEISHLNALNAIFAQIRLPEEELLAFIDTIKWDCEFVSAAAFCAQQGIPVYICSAGCDYYINRLIGEEIKRFGINLVTNHGVYAQDCGLKMIPLHDSPFYDEKVGISKAAVVTHLQNRGYAVVFAGDGPPDFAPAQLAETVFARKILLEKCLAANIKTQTFNSFADIHRYLDGG